MGGEIGRMEEDINPLNILTNNPSGTDFHECLGVHGNIKLEWILDK